MAQDPSVPFPKNGLHASTLGQHKALLRLRAINIQIDIYIYSIIQIIYSLSMYIERERASW